MNYIVIPMVLVMAFGIGCRAQNVTTGFDFQLFVEKFGNLEQMFEHLQSDIKKQEEMLENRSGRLESRFNELQAEMSKQGETFNVELTSKFQQLQVELKEQGSALHNQSTLLNTIGDESTSNFHQLQTDIMEQAEMSQSYSRNIWNFLSGGVTNSCVEKNITKSGRCTIQTFYKAFDVYYEQNLYDGGWIVIQNRFDGSVDFYRNWTEYKNGFGTVDGEYWLGLDNIHLLTSSRPHELLVHMEDFDGVQKYARYSEFLVGSEHEEYELKSLGSYNGMVKNLLFEGLMFLTFDRNNTFENNKSCAEIMHGAWWYINCMYATVYSNLNGKWGAEDSTMMSWSYILNGRLKISKMMIRQV